MTQIKVSHSRTVALTQFLVLAIVFLITGLRPVAAQTAATAGGGALLWKDTSQSFEARARDLVSRMTLQQKVGQMWNTTRGIHDTNSGVDIPDYDYWNECLHGVARNGTATVFPQAIGMAATWDTVLVHQESDTIATEARAKFRAYSEAHNGNSVNYSGLNFWTPNINIFRDPRWGRGQETYGEDPFLTGSLAVAFITGLQGDDPKYYKAMACAKHFAVHSGPETLRHGIDVNPPERDFYETYLPHFEMAVKEGKVGAVMGGYNSVYGKPCCANPLLLTDILRKDWGFQGQVVADCGAISDIWQPRFHHYVNTPLEAAVAAVKAGCNLSCLNDYRTLTQGVANGMITVKEIDDALVHSLVVRFRLGLFDPPEMVPYAKIPVTDNDTPAHTALALQVALKSMVLLKNDGVLPLDRAKIKRIAVIGTNATSTNMLLGNYEGKTPHPVTVLDGIKELLGAGVEVLHETGCPLAVSSAEAAAPAARGRRGADHLLETNEVARAEALAKAVEVAKTADAIIYVGGITAQLEGEELRGVTFDGFGGGDRSKVELPAVQTEMLKALRATGKPVIFVNCSGSAVSTPWEAENIPAILQAWYPGESGGTAVAQILFGDYNPAGRLPVTIYKSTEDVPAFTNYAMAGRTYRYMTAKPLYAFGHGLSYSKFDYQSAKLEKATVGAGDTLRVSVDVANTGARDGDEVVQVYFRHVNSPVPQPNEALCGFTRVAVAHGKTAKVTIEVPLQRLRYWDTTKKQYIVEPGKYEVLVGAASDDIRARLPLTVN